MAEDVQDSDVDEFDQDPSALVKKLRGELKARDKELADAKSARRELAFLKAGIDTSTRLGQLFAKSFEGDVSDVEAIKAEATELGLIGQAAETKETEEVGDTSAQERSALANNATADDGSGIDPRKVAMERANEAIKAGATWEQGAGGFVAELARAAMAGDQRVIVRGNAY